MKNTELALILLGSTAFLAEIFVLIAYVMGV